MNHGQARDWSRVPRIKRHTRERLDDLLCPLMQRAVRQYLRTRAEIDGSLIVDRDEPIDALVRALGAHEPEVVLARRAIVELLRVGVLESDGRSIWMPERLASETGAPALKDAEKAVPSAEPKPRQTSTARVRAHRERKRNERNAPDVSSAAAVPPEAVSVPVSSGVPPVSGSRGDRKQDPSNSQKQEKDQTNTPHHLENPRVSDGVSLDVSVEGDDDDEPPRGRRNGNEQRSRNKSERASMSPEKPLHLDVATRASLVVDRPELADRLRPEQWPEVRAVAAAFADARGCLTQPLGRYAQDRAVEQAVALYAAGYSQADLVHVVRAIARQPWSQGKGLASLLTFKVVDANRPKPLAKTETNLSPNAAAVLARVRQGRPTREVG